MKAVLLEVSHWHSPLYIKDLLDGGIEVVGFSDKNEEIRAKYSKLFRCEGYNDWKETLGSCSYDIAFAFGEHAQMYTIATSLLANGRPFSIEKPTGINSQEVDALSKIAADSGLLVGVPLVQRFGPLFALLKYLTEEEGAIFQSSSWRFNAGPPNRYNKMYSHWMLKPESSGGGCLINLAPHFIDLALTFMPFEPDTVFSRIDNGLHETAVEDTATLIMTSKSGGQATVQTGYNFPNSSIKREYSFSLSAKDHYVQSSQDGVTIIRSGKPPEFIKLNLDSDPLYGIYVQEFCQAVRNSGAFASDLNAMKATMEIIDAAYKSASNGAAVSI